MVPVHEVLQGLDRLAIAMVLGALLGLNRTMRRKPAGPRTFALVSMGAAMFTWLGTTMVSHDGDSAASLSRITQGLVTGVGFLGAGLILRGQGRQVRGLTSAAALWFAASLGGAAGAGQWAVGVVGAVMGLGVLSALPVEQRFTRRYVLRRRRQQGDGPDIGPPVEH
ncbi:MAG: MgtC/SapB family protein [Deltaproteobacteria bacterium]|nr:MgtC/SapB family protein [Deltaproteobacteria bacterium]